jgi:hypothetical protein
MFINRSLIALLGILALPSPLTSQSIRERSGMRSTGISIPGDLPPEVAQKLRAQALAQQNRGGGNKKNPEQERTQLLQQLIIDRSPSGILQARLQATRPEEGKPAPKPDEGTTANQPPKEDSPPEGLTGEQLEAFQKNLERKREATAKQKELEVKRTQYKKDVASLRQNVILGNWDEVRSYLDTLPDNDAQNAYKRILSQLAGPVNVQPRPELAALGAKPHTQAQYLRPSEIFALSDASKKEPDKQILEQLAKLVPRNPAPPASFFAVLKNGTRYFGTKDLATRLRTSGFLLNAGLLDEAVPYLPNDEAARRDKNFEALNLLARYHAEAHRTDKGASHLPTAWDLCLKIMGDKEAPINERGAALYRALALVPEFEDDAGKTWLSKTFTSPESEGFEILAAVGTLAAQSRQVRGNHFRLEQLKLQAAAAKALLDTGSAQLSDWAETLTLYTLNWNHEAEHSYRLDRNTSMRPQMQVDQFGNIFYQEERVAYQGTGITPIAAGDLLACRPDERWLALVDEPVRLDCLASASRLFLKVKEETMAFPLLKVLATIQPERARNLVSNMISVWAQNHNPNQQNRYRSSYYYFYGANRRAETIPLTRSKQERNLKELGTLVGQVRGLGLKERFDEELADAFIQAHSQAEVWRVEALESVFGKLDTLDPGTLSTLLERMRVNLATLWPNPKVQQQAQTKRKDKELQQHILKGYEAAKSVATDALMREPDNWRLQIQLASLRYEESNYKSSINPVSDHSTTKRASLDALATAAETYAATLPLEKKSDESTLPFETWFYAALGSPDLNALKAEHQPVTSEFPLIKSALEGLPEATRERHLERFATTLNNRLANVSPDLKYRYLDAALRITGPHERIKNAADVFTYYKDLITEIELVATIDGSDRIGYNEPFGLFVNLHHTKEIERESGGFQRYLQNQNSNPYGYNYGRNTEDYRDKFEKAARAALEEHFEVISLTFHNNKIQSRSDRRFGWRITPYAYFLLKAKGPEVDSIPPLKMDLDFLDTSGYVVLPVASSAIPIDASQDATTRPIRDLAVTLTLDERNSDKDKVIHLDVKASGHGLVPDLERLMSLPPEGFLVTDTEDRELLVEELDAETKDGAPLSTHEWRLTLAPAGNRNPTTFTFPTILVPVAAEDGLTLQRYEDVDLVSVPETVVLGATVGRTIKPWMILAGLFVLALGAAILWVVLRRSGPAEAVDHGPELPATLTPVTLLSFLERLHHRLPDNKRAELSTEIAALQDRFFGPANESLPDDELTKIATRWKKAA